MIQAVAARIEKNYLNQEQGILSWLLTTDHKRIAILYTFSITAFFFLGGFFALMMRLELLSPRNWLVSAETYNKLFTMHGIIMVWFFLIPSIPNTLGNFLIPMMVGAKDLAFPKLNLLSWYVFMLGGTVTVFALLRGGVDTGWTFYTPFSTSYSTTYVVAAAVGIFIAGFSTIMTALNFIATIHRMRAPGLTWFRLPIFVWSMYANSVVLVLNTPVLAITLLMIGVERVAQVGIFDPSLGGD
ncbi:MAG TPA: cbb3-type cytochrome c oxidase subunit I, partial [Bryobacteraceae bacterium]|nr:cbb3-type cytochrome c oxidase subunit I [Bryobacteraceae bacterium]